MPSVCSRQSFLIERRERILFKRICSTEQNVCSRNNLSLVISDPFVKMGFEERIKHRPWECLAGCRVLRIVSDLFKEIVLF